MCVFESGRYRGLDSEESRSLYYTDPDTGGRLPPRTDLRFVDFVPFGRRRENEGGGLDFHH